MEVFDCSLAVPERLCEALEALLGSLSRAHATRKRETRQPHGVKLLNLFFSKHFIAPNGSNQNCSICFARNIFIAPILRFKRFF